MRDGNVSGLHGGGTPRTRDRSSAGRPGTAQGRPQEPAGCNSQQVQVDSAPLIQGSGQFLCVSTRGGILVLYLSITLQESLMEPNNSVCVF